LKARPFSQVVVKGKTGYTLRPHLPSDMDWIVAAHKEIPSDEYGFNQDFARMAEDFVANFVRNYDASRERCWIADVAGEPVGCVFLVRNSDEVAQVRLLLVVPKARGLGIGRGLVDECVRFATGVGYEKIVLQTDNIAMAARHLYEKAGFRLVRSEPHQFYGRETLNEQWELPLRPAV